MYKSLQTSSIAFESRGVGAKERAYDMNCPLYFCLALQIYAISVFVLKDVLPCPTNKTLHYFLMLISICVRPAE